jgi:hypothetical protein
MRWQNHERSNKPCDSPLTSISRRMPRTTGANVDNVDHRAHRSGRNRSPSTSRSTAQLRRAGEALCAFLKGANLSELKEML